VAVAIVTSAKGVLVGRRHGGVPLWVFPGGKIKPGETPEAAAVRETREEAGLWVRVAGILGSRVHPATGVLILYVAAVPADEADRVAAGDGEVAEVRWVSLAEAAGLMSDMAGPVRRHLRRTLRSQASGSPG
jgi:8-oxo-dGTP diphosphatase